MNNKPVEIEDSWKKVLLEEFSKPYFGNIRKTLHQLKNEGKTVYPPGKLIFNAFNTTPFNKVKVVILGQDPYHNPGEAMGLSFSVPREKRIPPSLRNIYKELHGDLNIEIPSHGDLSHWARQGVFLLNAMLTVEHNNAGSHRAIGWQDFTNVVIEKLSQNRDHLVFILWGNFAKSKSSLIDAEKHLILESAHPSPFTGKAFFGNHHFSKTNEFLMNNKIDPIDWKID